MLGSLEKRILSVLHKKRNATARDIYKALRDEGMSVTYVTVNTVLSRLNRKGFVKRTKEPFRGKFRYTYEYVKVKDQLITDFLEDIDLLFGEEGVDHLRMKLKYRELASTEEIPTPIKDSIPSIEMRISLSRINAQNAIIKKVEDISGQNVLACYQCGKCSAGCPMVSLMDLLPNQIIRLVQLGQFDDVLNSKTIWLCASCFSCSTRCPKGVDLAKIMEALRLLLLRKNANYIELSDLDIDENLPQIALVSNFRKMTG
jgi:heterodisulfide reductase subunit C